MYASSTSFVLRENRMPELVLTDHLEIHYLELEKIPLSQGRTKLDGWLGFLKYGGEEMKTLLSDDDINVAQRRFKDFQRDEELRHRQLARYMGRLDYNSNLARAKEKGLEEGRAEGKAEGKAEGVREGFLLTAKNLLAAGAAIDLIVRATGLSEEEILAIKE
jgi:predicted transposase/invertase (TIGR01784 family)